MKRTQKEKETRRLYREYLWTYLDTFPYNLFYFLIGDWRERGFKHLSRQYLVRFGEWVDESIDTYNRAEELKQQERDRIRDEAEKEFRQL